MADTRQQSTEDATVFSEENEDTQKDKFLTFHIAKEDYGIEIRHVTEIIGIQRITQIPSMPVFIKGVINLRGKVIPVMDIRSRFGLEEREYDDRTCIIVVNINNTSVGLVVDTVNEVADIPENDIEPAPNIQKDRNSDFIHGLGKVGNDVKILLNVNELLFDEELESIESEAQSQSSKN